MRSGNSEGFPGEGDGRRRNNVGEIGKGILVLLGVSRDDSEKDAVYLLEKILESADF
jgi:D-Tyr-tRNAtyr deacylase